MKKSGYYSKQRGCGMEGKEIDLLRGLPKWEKKNRQNKKHPSSLTLEGYEVASLPQSLINTSHSSFIQIQRLFCFFGVTSYSTDRKEKVNINPPGAPYPLPPTARTLFSISGPCLHPLSRYRLSSSSDNPCRVTWVHWHIACACPPPVYDIRFFCLPCLP